MKTKGHFIRGLLIYCLVLTLLVVGALTVLHRFLTAYEDSRPVHAVDAYMQTLTVEDVIVRCEKLLSDLNPALQTREEAEAIISEALKEGFRAVKDPVSQDEILYNVLSGRQKVGSFRLIANETGSFGMPVWTVEGESFDLSALQGPENVLTVPETAVVTFLGKTLSEDFVTQSGIPMEYFKEFPQAGLPGCCTYQVKGYLGEPKWQVFTQDGKDVTGQDYQEIFSGEECSGDQRAALEARVLKFLDQYIAYCGSNKSTARGNLYSMKKSIVPDGDLFKRLSSALDGLNFGQSLRDVRGETQIHTMKKVTEELYYVDVTYLVDTTGKKGVVRTTNNLKLLLVPSGDTFLVSDICSY